MEKEDAKCSLGMTEVERLRAELQEVQKERYCLRLGQQVTPMELQTTASSRMAALINDADAIDDADASARYGGVRVGEASHPGPSFLRLRHATSVVNVAPTVDSGRFSALVEDHSAVSNIVGFFGRGSVGAHECSSVSSESCWGEMEDQ